MQLGSRVRSSSWNIYIYIVTYYTRVCVVHIEGAARPFEKLVVQLFSSAGRGDVHVGCLSFLKAGRL